MLRFRSHSLSHPEKAVPLDTGAPQRCNLQLALLFCMPLNLYTACRSFVDVCLVHGCLEKFLPSRVEYQEDMAAAVPQNPESLETVGLGFAAMRSSNVIAFGHVPRQMG